MFSGIPFMHEEVSETETAREKNEDDVLTDWLSSDRKGSRGEARANTEKASFLDFVFLTSPKI